MTDVIRLYLDEDAMRTGIVLALRARHIDVTTALEVDLIGRSDDDNLKYAIAQSRVLFSFNRGDFIRLHNQYVTNHQHHSGIIISDQLPTSLVLPRLFKLLNARSSEDMQDSVEFLGNWR